MNIFEMSDEEIMKMETPPASAGGNTSEEKPEEEELDNEEVDTPDEEVDPEDDPLVEKDDEPVVPGSDETPEGDGNDDPDVDEKPADAADDKSEKPKDQEPKPEGDKPAETDKAKQPETPVAAVDYEAEYKKLMAPFKANGREINLTSTDEVIKLMQMGANYAKKMQAIQPNLRILKMLENNGLLDEEKINYLIDLNSGDKGALHKALKDTKIDPMDFDTTQDVAYKPKNHKVSDTAIQFQSVVDELKETEYGMAIIIEAHNKFDAASQKRIYDEPEVLQALAEHKQKGYYDQIAREVERLKLLGHSQVARLSFLEAYKLVGDVMQAQGVFGNPENQTGQSGTSPKPQTPTPVAVAQPAPKKPSTNGQRAKAASPSAKSNTATKPSITENPLMMADEDFLKSMNGRI